MSTGNTCSVYRCRQLLSILRAAISASGSASAVRRSGNGSGLKLGHIAEAGFQGDGAHGPACIWFNRARLAPLVADLDDRVLQPIASNTEPMRYLVGYGRHIEEQQC